MLFYAKRYWNHNDHKCAHRLSAPFPSLSLFLLQHRQFAIRSQLTDMISSPNTNKHPLCRRRRRWHEAQMPISECSASLHFENETNCTIFSILCLSLASIWIWMTSKYRHLNAWMLLNWHGSFVRSFFLCHQRSQRNCSAFFSLRLPNGMKKNENSQHSNDMGKSVWINIK